MKEDIDDMLQELGLRQVAGNKIGTPIQRGISGGQKRRVSLGCAAITDPQILFLDEVTSGLDVRGLRVSKCFSQTLKLL